MVNLKKIEMYGFKSFADKLEMTFDNTFTAIVGPNGCGKSNISDAVRFVLGEQSAKSLRGKTMSDFIFSGTDARKSMSYCEVSLHLDNSSRFFDLDMDEIILSRKLYRTNESEYYINKNLVRLKDISEMLHQAGLGRDGYSSVGQGRMDAILNAKPEDRRAIFEEALGISQFRIKKVETERKLAKTTANMDSLNLILSELNRQLEPLRKQSINAEKYLDLSEKLKYKEINQYIYTYDNASADKAMRRQVIDTLKDEFEQDNRIFEQYQEEYDNLMNEISNIDNSLAQLRDQQMSLAVEIERQTGAQQLLKEKIDANERHIANLNTSIDNDQQDLQATINNIEQTENDIKVRSVDAQNLQAKVSDLNDAFVKQTAICDELQKKLNAIQIEYNNFIRSQSNAKALQVSNETQRKNMLARLEELALSEKELSQRIALMSGEEQKLFAQYEKDKLERGNLLPVIDQSQKEIEALNKQFNTLKNQLSSLQQQVASERGKLSALKEFVDNYKGYDQSVQQLMGDTKSNATLKDCILGVVANVLSVKENYAVAIESALGNKVQNVIVKSTADAKYVVDHLKYRQYGRVSMLPLANLKRQNAIDQAVKSENGFVALAVDVVSCDEKFVPVLHSLLGNTIVVKDYQTAVALSQKYNQSFAFVTLEGEKIAKKGTISVGSAQKKKGALLSYDSENKAKEQILADLQAKIDDVTAQQSQKDAQLTDARNQLTEQTTLLHNLNLAISTGKERLDASKNLNQKDKANIQKVYYETENIKSRLEALSKQSVLSDEELAQNDQKEAKYVADITDLREKLTVQNTKKNNLSSDLSSFKVRLAGLNVNLDNAKHSLEANKIRANNLQNGIANKKNTLTRLTYEVQGFYEQLSRWAVDQSRSEELEQVMLKVKSADKHKADLNDKFNQVGEQRLELTTKLEAMKGKIATEEYILGKIDDDLQELQQHILEDYNVTYSQAMQFKDEQYDYVKGKEEITHIKNQINRLGYVNVNAINDYKDVSQRHGDITTQVEDLEKAKKDLLNVLATLTKEIEERFEEGIEKINVNFKQVFTELFSGGNARLLIDTAEGKAPLDYGVEIVAQPPGKRLQTISLLSGGERTLTAAAILFAILKLKPLPFCVLDEIEAALDDANADKIARYIKKFANDTQFLVITHKKPTMENADVLYGVTMEEKGVSKVVNVKLTEAIKQAA